MAEDSLEAIRHNSDELAAFLGVNARFDGLESELRRRFEQIDRLEERSDETLARLDHIETRLERIEKMLAKVLNVGERR
jgi:4-hydroxyphenylpyruvate dioxygenase-like putative hemolysin